MCGTNWPRVMENGKPVFQPCPECVDSETTMSASVPIDEDEAMRRKKTAAFEAYYAEHVARQQAQIEAFEASLSTDEEAA